MINFFDTELEAIKIGNDDIEKVCIGSTEIWPYSEVDTHFIEIAGPDVITGDSGSVSVIYDNRVPITSGITWAITLGNQYASINSNGEITINQGAEDEWIIIEATYNGMVAHKSITVTYSVTSSSETIVTMETDDQGNVTTTTRVIVTNSDGSGEESISSITHNSSGDVIGTSQGSVTNNSDGSSQGTITNYDASGDPISATNTDTDTSGNVNTQQIEYNEDGDPVVTGYTIDTSENPDGEKTYNSDGVNTEYYAFDMTRGFECRMHFTINYMQQPAGQNQNLHNILTMKRASPEPWYGFQLRHTGTDRNIIIGTQFSTGSNLNTNIAGTQTEIDNVCEFDLKITYDPTAVSNKFICRNMITGVDILTRNDVFPDIEALKYLKVTIGYALDPNGDPYRYSNINVKDFYIIRLPEPIAVPVVTCNGKSITLTCDTPNAFIYYRLNQTGIYIHYTSPITISDDTVIETYAELDGRVSLTATETCIYDSGIVDPVIECNGEEVSITCETLGVDIYYRLNQTGNFLLYEYAIPISEDTYVEAYAELKGDHSHTVSMNCIYDGGVQKPAISFDGEVITLTCESVGASIYYRLNQTGSYILYESPITIIETTVIETYSKLGEKISPIVTDTCIYNPTHDYSLDYLTFRVLTAGTIAWQAFGTGYTREIQYSINGGSWTSLTASTTPATIQVAADDVVRFKGTNNTYAGSKANYDGFEGGTATFDIEGNIMSLVYGDNFVGNNSLSGTYNFCSIFKKSNVVSAENLVLPVMSLTNYCYRAMFSLCPSLIKAPALPATTLAQGCYWHMFEECPITDAPELPATVLVRECYGYMFTRCSHLNYIKCLAIDGFSTYQCTQGWVTNVAPSGTFVKDANVTWGTGNNGIPTSWVVVNEGEMTLEDPVITCDGEEVTITCATQGAEIYYNINQNRSYTLYTEPIAITEDVTVDAYATKADLHTMVVTQECTYSPETPLQASNKDITSWRYNGLTVSTPYSVNAIDGHSSSYAKGTFNFETDVKIKKEQPAYLWFQHADQSASIYVDNTLVEKHWGGYNAFFVDISNFIHKGMNTIKVALKNNEGNNLAPCNGDFNFNATLGNVKLFTSPVLPAMDYGYDGFHVTSQVTSSLATVIVKTSIPLGASVKCMISDGVHEYTETKNSDGEEMSFIDTIQNPHLWNGTSDPHLYTITLEVYYNGELYHRYQRPYGLRFYRYAVNDTTILPNNEPYTGFLLNGSPYLLRGVCMHDDIDGKANALSASDYAQEFAIIQELGCNFIRLAHYPHPKEVYDYCDQLGIIVQTEVPCVNKLQSNLPADYYTHLEGQYRDMVNQHYNHPCIMFWGLSNETITDDKEFGKTKIEAYTSLIKSLDSERLVGYVMSHSYANPSSYYNNPNVDWFGCNIYVGWYNDKASNDPTSQLNTRVANIITNLQKPMAFSEYGCGGTQNCHSETPLTTTTRGNYERHDIEYQMWLHEGHIAALRNFPQLLFTSQWQLFDIAVSNRNEGYTICPDGENASIDDNLRRLNNKGLVERDHITKKDTFYIYKAEWSSQIFVHICGKDYQRLTNRVIKCYSNESSSLKLYVNDALIETVNVVNHIAMFTARTFNSGDVIRVDGDNSSDTFTI